MTDIVERLRTEDWWRGAYGSKEILCREAADEIERLRAEVNRQRNRIASLRGMIEDEEESDR